MASIHVRCCTLALAILTLPSSRADIVTDWNERALATMAAEGPAVANSGTASSRTMAMVHIALFDAINATSRRYAPYLPALPDVSGASAEAAAHAAAHSVLADLFPKQRPALDAAYGAAIAGLADGAAKAAGIAAGDTVAAAVLAQRRTDGFAGSPETYRPAAAPGVYVPTALPVVTHVALLRPFALQGVSQFRPGPPPALDGALWARDYNETKELGAANSTKRTAWQTETARFWVLVGTPAWNQAARGLSSARPLPLPDSARLFAQLNMAIFDAYLAVFDAKYQYNFWRPITAIRNGDRDGNEATERDAAWRTLIDTPLHPEYPCAHCTVDGAAGAVLKAAFGTGTLPEFTLDYAAMPGVTRKYTSIQQLEDEVFMARIWGGVHWRNSNEVGNALGKSVGEYVLQNTLRPRR